MAQTARPDADTSVGDWSASSGTDLFDLINDATVDNTDYIYVSDDSFSGAEQPITLSLSSVTDPGVGTGHSVVVRASDESGMGYITLNVELKDGSTSIKSEDFTPGSSPGNHTMTLSTSQANEITTGGYADLTLVLTATDTMMSEAETRVYDAYFECPTPEVDATNTQFFSLVKGGALGTSISLAYPDDAPPKVRI